MLTQKEFLASICDKLDIVMGMNKQADDASTALLNLYFDSAALANPAALYALLEEHNLPQEVRTGNSLEMLANYLKTPQGKYLLELIGQLPQVQMVGETPYFTITDEDGNQYEVPGEMDNKGRMLSLPDQYSSLLKRRASYLGRLMPTDDARVLVLRYNGDAAPWYLRWLHPTPFEPLNDDFTSYYSQRVPEGKTLTRPQAEAAVLQRLGINIDPNGDIPEGQEEYINNLMLNGLLDGQSIESQVLEYMTNPEYAKQQKQKVTEGILADIDNLSGAIGALHGLYPDMTRSIRKELKDTGDRFGLFDSGVRPSVLDAYRLSGAGVKQNDKESLQPSSALVWDKSVGRAIDAANEWIGEHPAVNWVDDNGDVSASDLIANTLITGAPRMSLSALDYVGKAPLLFVDSIANKYNNEATSLAYTGDRYANTYEAAATQLKNTGTTNSELDKWFVPLALYGIGIIPAGKVVTTPFKPGLKMLAPIARGAAKGTRYFSPAAGKGVAKASDLISALSKESPAAPAGWSNLWTSQPVRQYMQDAMWPQPGRHVWWSTLGGGFNYMQDESALRQRSSKKKGFISSGAGLEEHSRNALFTKGPESDQYGTDYGAQRYGVDEYGNANPRNATNYNTQ